MLLDASQLLIHAIPFLSSLFHPYPYLRISFVPIVLRDDFLYRQLVEEKDIPHLVLLVHLNSEDVKSSDFSQRVPSPTPPDPSSGTSSPSPPSALDTLESTFPSPGPSNGWVVVRKLPQLIDLHRKLWYGNYVW